jgi:hypothetical protein
MMQEEQRLIPLYRDLFQSYLRDAIDRHFV